MKREGVARHIGVSNFNAALIEEAVKLATEPLVNNQIELHPYLDQTKTIAASRKAGLSVTAYSPIARGRVKGDAVLSRIGKAHGKTAAQVCLRYLVQQDIIVIPQNQPPGAAEGERRDFRLQARAGRDEGDRRAGEPARQHRQLTPNRACSRPGCPARSSALAFNEAQVRGCLPWRNSAKLRSCVSDAPWELASRTGDADAGRPEAAGPNRMRLIIDPRLAQGRESRSESFGLVPKCRGGSMPWQNPRSEQSHQRARNDVVPGRIEPGPVIGSGMR